MDVDLTEDEIQAAFSGIFDETVANELHELQKANRTFVKNRHSLHR